MKKIILYLRVSTDEQADKGFSMRDQEQKLLNYCSNNNFNVLMIFREDHSAKTFNRPEIKKLIQYTKTNKFKVDQLLFTKWDRFSRNTSESYNKIKDFNELVKKIIPKKNKLFLGINCTQRIPIIELLPARFR